MGFFSAIFDATKQANDAANGERLLREVQSSFLAMEDLDGEVHYSAMTGYLQILERFNQEMPNWSADGRIEIGRTMQKQARAAINTDMGGGYAKWLAGAWLESKERNSMKAVQAHLLLDHLANHARKEILNLVLNDSAPEPRWNYTSFEEWYAVCKRAAAEVNEQLAQDADGSSMLDFMDHAPLRNAFKDKVEPKSLGRSFARQYDFSTFVK